ncbi:hypothetical protein MYP_4576 [Sporocytophaga myxococcoides]|uniref:Uncharacterized protein n=1 Tax=Sporocytophaga myxococcoides TaxID=153721 RepID=A0A098LLZ1_9BACT|nr:hypothetical protein MYP_4576 [Sporocytophaga myxococcoides]
MVYEVIEQQVLLKNRGAEQKQHKLDQQTNKNSCSSEYEYLPEHLYKIRALFLANIYLKQKESK